MISPLKSFLSKATADGRIKDWVIAWHQPARSLARLTLLARRLGTYRHAYDVAKARDDFIGSDRKHTWALEPIAGRHGGVPGLLGSDGRGVVLVYLADDRPRR